MSTVQKKLYKYRDTSEYTETVFGKAELYFAPPSAFNDPFDCGFHILVEGAANQRVFESIAFGVIEEKLPDLSLQEKLDAAEQVGTVITEEKRDWARKTSVDKLANDTNNKVGILSLSEKNDDILMWSHYADCHKGICLEFSTSEPSFFDMAQPVNYGEDYPTLDLHEIVVNEDLRKAAAWMLTKAKQWEYEREWRVLDFDGGPGPRHFPPADLTGVILGCRISEEEQAKVLSWIRSFSPRPQVYQAREASGHFRLDIEPVPAELCR